jgi:MoaA/NifB/PqqE/SkfB family radical SAM enzyme
MEGSGMSIMRAVGQAVDVLRLLPIGGPSCCNIAVTNVCNATCDFCNYAKDKDFVTEKKWLDSERLKRALDILHARGIRYITFSGGEPMLHPEMCKMIESVAYRGMRPAMVTNGSALTERNMRDLAAAGLKTLFISIDSPEAEKHEKNRGLPGVFGKIKAGNALLKELGIKTVASCTINRLIGDDFETLFAALDELGFSTVTFTYPKKELNSGSLVFSSSSLIDFSDLELAQVLEILRSKKQKFGILNPAESLSEMVRFLKKEKQQFECYGGYKYFALDVNFNIYRCDFWHEPMGTIEEFQHVEFVRDGCTKCMSVCYRDSSVFLNLPVAIGDAIKHTKRGRIDKAARALAQPSVRKSAKSLMNEWQTLKRLARTS